MGPLKGVRVVEDLSQVISAHAGRRVACRPGPDVVKIEDMAGDPARTISRARRTSRRCSSPVIAASGAGRRSEER